MAIRDEAKLIQNEYNKNCPLLMHNYQIFDIYEGNLIKYVLDDLAKQFSPETYSSVTHRVAPINLLRRLIQKLSTLYSTPPNRETLGSKSDEVLIELYQKEFNMNVNGQLANEFFNQFKNFAWEPYLTADMQPRLRVIPSDRFFVFSTDRIDPMRVTHFVKLHDKMIRGELKKCLYIYTDEEFLITDTDGKIQDDLMQSMGLDGTNPYGRIPFVYSVRSSHHIMPVPDSDLLNMVKLFPVLLTDLNYATMYQSFSIIYGIDVDDEQIKMAPNAFWRFKSDPTADAKKPEIGTIKPTVDTEKVIQLIQTEMSMWLQSRSIRPGNTGQLNAENFSSGVSKMVDEMDTVEDRERQVPYFEKAEDDLFDLLINALHPVWIQQPEYMTRMAFSADAAVKVTFEEQKAIRDQSLVIDDALKLVNSGLITNEKALSMIFPDLSPEEIKKLKLSADVDNTVETDEEDEDGDQEDQLPIQSV